MGLLLRWFDPELFPLKAWTFTTNAINGFSWGEKVGGNGEKRRKWRERISLSLYFLFLHLSPQIPLVSQGWEESLSISSQFFSFSPFTSKPLREMFQVSRVVKVYWCTFHICNWIYTKCATRNVLSGWIILGMQYEDAYSYQLCTTGAHIIIIILHHR